jgi:hypothetical protein
MERPRVVSDSFVAITRRIPRTMLRNRLTRLRWVATTAITAGAMTVGVEALMQEVPATAALGQEAAGKEGGEPGRSESVSFQRIGLSADDLADVTGLDVYKFRVDLTKGRRFHVVLRVRQDEMSPTRELVGIPFQSKSDGPTNVCVSFLRTDGKLQGFLLSTEPRAQYRVNCSGGATGGFVIVIENPLGDIAPELRGLLAHQSNERNAHGGLKETRLITVAAQKPGGGRGLDMSGYPRAEVVITEER